MIFSPLLLLASLCLADNQNKVILNDITTATVTVTPGQQDVPHTIAPPSYSVYQTTKTTVQDGVTKVTTINPQIVNDITIWVTVTAEASGEGSETSSTTEASSASTTEASSASTSEAISTSSPSTSDSSSVPTSSASSPSSSPSPTSSADSTVASSASPSDSVSDSITHTVTVTDVVVLTIYVVSTVY